MSLYNSVLGVNPATFFILPMLGKHPDEYARFRDCFVHEGNIQIYTRTGGPNRETFAIANTALQEMPGFIKDFDDPDDTTYAIFEFKVPDVWHEDFMNIVSGKPISDAYLAEMKRVFPKLADKFNSTFRPEIKTMSGVTSEDTLT